MMIKKIYKKINILQSLASGIIQYNVVSRFKPLAPTELMINTTYRCNSQCIMCHIWQRSLKNEFSLGEWQQVFKDKIFLNISRLTLAGGEPILNNNLYDLVRLCTQSMPKLQKLNLVTNGFLPAKTGETIEKIAVLCLKRNLNLGVSVSLDAIGKKHEEIRRVPHAFRRVKSTIIILKKLQKKYNFDLSVGCLICHKNLYQVEEYMAWCQKNNLTYHFQLIGFHKNFVNNLNEKNNLDFTKNDRKYLYAFLHKLISGQKHGLHSRLQAYYWHDMLNLYQGGQRQTPCPFIYDAFVIDCLGDIYYCLSEKKIGNCRTGKTVSDIYFDKKNLEFRNWLKNNACLRCNSGCSVTSAITKEFMKFSRYYLRGN